MSDESYEDWLSTRPECVQKLAREFPLGTTLDLGNDEIGYLIGWTEGDEILFTRENPADLVDDDNAYERAMAEREVVCAAHYRGDGQ